MALGKAMGKEGCLRARGGEVLCTEVGAPQCVGSRLWAPDLLCPLHGAGGIWVVPDPWHPMAAVIFLLIPRSSFVK